MCAALLTAVVALSGDGCQPAPPVTGMSEYVLEPTKQTYVDGDLPNTNFASSPVLRVKGTTRITLVQFDEMQMISDVGTNDVASAQLTLWVLSATSCARHYEIHPMTQTWTATGATYDCSNDSSPGETTTACPAGAAWDLRHVPTSGPIVTSPTDVVGCTSYADGSTRIVFDVAADVRAFVDG